MTLLWHQCCVMESRSVKWGLPKILRCLYRVVQGDGLEGHWSLDCSSKEGWMGNYLFYVSFMLPHAVPLINLQFMNFFFLGLNFIIHLWLFAKHPQLDDYKYGLSWFPLYIDQYSFCFFFSFSFKQELHLLILVLLCAAWRVKSYFGLNALKFEISESFPLFNRVVYWLI